MTTIRDTIDRAIGPVVCNASNFPERVQARLLGQDMAPLRKRLTDAVLAALSSPPTDDSREALIDELTATVGWMKRTRNLIDADRVMRAIAFIREVRPRGPVTDAEATRDALIEGVKLEARNLMRSDPRVWHEALESALDKTLPGFWNAARQARS
jgi:hypothetical protein